MSGDLGHGERRVELGPAVPELPVRDVKRAQQYYCEVLRFEEAWTEPEEGIGAVVRGRCTLFLRRTAGPIAGAVHWIFAADVERVFAEMQAAGAEIVEPLELKPWGIRQFALRDPDGNLFYVHRDEPKG